MQIWVQVDAPKSRVLSGHLCAARRGISSQSERPPLTQRDVKSRIVVAEMPLTFDLAGMKMRVIQVRGSWKDYGDIHTPVMSGIDVPVWGQLRPSTVASIRARVFGRCSSMAMGSLASSSGLVESVGPASSARSESRRSGARTLTPPYPGFLECLHAGSAGYRATADGTGDRR